MTTDEILQEIQARGLTVAVKEGRPILRGSKVLASPPLMAAIKWHRDEIVRRFAPEPPPVVEPAPIFLDDDALVAIAERAYHDEPDWGNAGVCARESVIVRAEGFSAMAMPADFVQWWDRHNAIAREAVMLRQSGRRFSDEVQG